MNNVIWYADSLEAYRSDRFTGFVTQPAEGGVISGQNGYWGGYYSTTPVADSSELADAGAPTGLYIGIGAAIVVLGGLAVFLVARRRSATSDDRA